MARIVVVSNRVSVPSGDGAKRAGGLEVALRPALERNGGVWFGWSGKAVPSADVEMHTVYHKNVTYVVTDLSEEDYQEYYNGFANRVLWPILHFRLDLAEFARRDLTGYMRANEHFATELEKIIEPDDLIWVHDYHLIPIAAALRGRGHANRMGFFLHVPRPPPEMLASLPHHEQLIPLLLQYDVVGFQTEGDSSNFVRYLIAENEDSRREMRVFRSEIPEYLELAQAVGSIAGRINGKYGEVSWTPIRYVNRVYSRSVLAGLYRTARVGLVTPLRDGMNLEHFSIRLGVSRVREISVTFFFGNTFEKSGDCSPKLLNCARLHLA